MFSQADAAQLRAGLPQFEFAATASTASLVQPYLDHYGMDFGTEEVPINHGMGRFVSESFELVAHHFSPSSATQRGTVFLLHGYYDHTGIYGHLIRHCLQAGFDLVIYDSPGHGLSSGAPASIDSFRRYTAAFARCLELAQRAAVLRPWFVIAQSTGGAVVMDAILDRYLEEQHSFARLILLAPLLRPHNWALSKLLFSISRRFFAHTPRSFSSSSHDADFTRFIKHGDPLQNRSLARDWVLAMIEYQRRFARAEPRELALDIIQGSADTTVDWKYNLAKIEEKFRGSRRHMVTDARHHLVNESEEFRARIFSLLDEIMDREVY